MGIGKVCLEEYAVRLLRSTVNCRAGHAGLQEHDHRGPKGDSPVLTQSVEVMHWQQCLHANAHCYIERDQAIAARGRCEPVIVLGEALGIRTAEH